MHVIVLRQDMNGFQHVHPEFNSENGYFTLKDLTLPTDGSYILYFDFTPKNGEPIVLFEGIAVGDSSKNSKPNLTLSQSPQIVDKFSVQLGNLEEKKIFKSGEETKVTFHINGKENQPIEHVENYLGAKGHLVIIKEGSLDYIHAHPEEKKIVAAYNDIPFNVHFPVPGKYKLFLQFQYWGKVYTTEYVVEVVPGDTNTAPSEHMIHQ